MTTEPHWLTLASALADTGVFIQWYRGDPRARLFFRNPAIEIYYSRVTRKELLRPPISDAEKARIGRLLAGMRLINPDNQIAAAYSDLLSLYAYLRVHLPDALIAATAWVKNLPLVMTNVRHFSRFRRLMLSPSRTWKTESPRLALITGFRQQSLWKAIILATLLIPPLSTPAQEKQADAPIKVQTTLVSVPVIVSDRQGRYISGLRLRDFKLYQDRAEQPISVFDAAEEPLNVALLIDTSRSTLPVLDDIKSAGVTFLKELRSQDRAMVLSADYDVHVLSQLTSERKTLEKAVKSAKTGEQFGTVLRDGIAEVIERSFKRVDGRKAIIVLTDGKDAGSRIGEQALLDEAAESGAMIYTVFFETQFPGRGRNEPGRFPRRRGWGRDRFPPDRPRRNEQRRQRAEMKNEQAIAFLEKLAEVSAGRYYNGEASDLKKTFGLIAEELRHQYRLGFYPDNSKIDGNRHTLRVEVTAPDAIVRARRSYQAASLSNGS